MDHRFLLRSCMYLETLVHDSGKVSKLENAKLNITCNVSSVSRVHSNEHASAVLWLDFMGVNGSMRRAKYISIDLRDNAEPGNIDLSNDLRVWNSESPKVLCWSVVDLKLDSSQLHHLLLWTAPATDTGRKKCWYSLHSTCTPTAWAAVFSSLVISLLSLPLAKISENLPSARWSQQVDRPEYWCGYQGYIINLHHLMSGFKPANFHSPSIFLYQCWLVLWACPLTRTSDLVSSVYLWCGTRSWCHPIISSSDTRSNLLPPQKCWVIKVLSPRTRGDDTIWIYSAASISGHSLPKNDL